MRVIAGKAKSRKLRSVPGDVVRPITDRVKESLFNILGDTIVDALFLDLFAGTGSVGIEALSRGARRAVFVERSRRAIETIKENLKITGLATQAEAPLNPPNIGGRGGRGKRGSSKREIRPDLHRPAPVPGPLGGDVAGLG